MPKKKRTFTRENSTKYVLITEGRDENGERIKQNTLVQVPYHHKPGSSLLFPPNFQNTSNKAKASEPETKITDARVTEDAKTKGSCEVTCDKNADLEKILHGMEELDEEDGQYEDLSGDEYEDLSAGDLEDMKRKMTDAFLREAYKSGPLPSNIQVELLDDCSDFEDGQFDDTDFDQFFDSQPKNRLTSAREDCDESTQLLNEGFEKMLSLYSEDLIGALDDEEVDGGTFSIENEDVLKYIKTPLEKFGFYEGLSDEDLKKRIVQLSEIHTPVKLVEVVTARKVEFDCESILSTYSSIYNHPTVIKEEPKIRKIKVPKNPFKAGLTKSKLKQLDSVSEGESEEERDDDEASEVSIATTYNIRPKGETPEEKRERKARFREAKRESRALKKENKIAFKLEKEEQNRIAMNVRRNAGIKLL